MQADVVPLWLMPDRCYDRPPARYPQGRDGQWHFESDGLEKFAELGYQ